MRAPSSRADAAGLARAARERLHIPGWTTPPRPSAAARGFHRPLPADGRGGGGQRVRRGNAGNAPPTSPPSGNEAAASAGRRQAGDPGPRGAPWRWHCGWMVVEGGVPSLLSDRAIQMAQRPISDGTTRRTSANQRRNISLSLLPSRADRSTGRRGDAAELGDAGVQRQRGRRNGRRRQLQLQLWEGGCSQGRQHPTTIPCSPAVDCTRQSTYSTVRTTAHVDENGAL